MAMKTANNSIDIPFVLSCITNEILFAVDKTEIVFEIIAVVINIVTSLLGTLANGIVITAYYRSQQLRTIQNTIFFLLAATDINISAIAQPIAVGAIMSGLMGKRDCLVWEIATVSSWLFLAFSFATIVILSWQSYITLAYPYWSEAVFTKHRLKIAVALTWLLTLAIVVKLTFLYHLNLAFHIATAVIILTMISVTFTWV